MNFEQISKLFLEMKLVDGKEPSKKVFYHFLKEKLPNSWPFSEPMISSLIHKSFKHENSIDFDHNERLEFLGDSVLQLMISEKLMAKFPDFSEGQLSKLRSALVNESSLTRLANIMGLSPFIFLGKGELKEQGHLKNSILSDTFEAYLGALYLEFGYKECVSFIDKLLDAYLVKHQKEFIHAELTKTFDAKTKLQEITMSKFKQTPEYRCETVKEKGQEKFSISVYVDQKKLGELVHLSKKKGMQELAKIILEEKRI